MIIDPVQALSIVATLILLEAVLSFDNAAILAVMSRKLPEGGGRRRALNYGLLIAYGLRVIAILAAVLLVQHEWFLTVGGAYLLYLFVKHFVDVLFVKKEKHDQPKDVKPARGLFGLTPLQSVVIQIGVVDLAFALDQVVAAVAFTKDVDRVAFLGGLVTYQQALILTAATAGLISLRVLAPFISRLMDWLPILEDMAFVAVGFVGSLLLVEHPPFVASNSLHHIGEVIEPVKIPITLGLFVVPILIKLLFKVPRGHSHEHARDERAIDAAQPGSGKK
jgi:YkoY family integral membrane protein